MAERQIIGKINRLSVKRRNEFINKLPNDLRERVKDMEERMHDNFNWCNIGLRMGELTAEQAEAFKNLLLNSYFVGSH